MISKGTFVEITTRVLESDERSNAIPEDTKNTPLIMWVKGYTTKECNLGEVVEIETVIGRKVSGEVSAIEPYYSHDFGKYVSEIAYIGKQAKDILFK